MDPLVANVVLGVVAVLAVRLWGTSTPNRFFEPSTG